MKCATIILGLVSAVASQQTLWQQCGGIDWKGSKTCIDSVCCELNPWYSQCLNACANSPSSSRTTTTSKTTTRLSTTTRIISTTSRTSTTPIVSSTTRVTTTPVVSSTTSSRTTTRVPTTTTSTAAVSTFTNPVVYVDYPDNDVFLGPDGYYYLSASNFHFSPGAPILRSGDLQNWEAVGHSIPTLDFGDNYSLLGPNKQAYRRGTWASSLRYRKSNKTWYWVGCIDFWNSFVYTAPAPEGPWTRLVGFWGRCFYDCGLFFDDDDTPLVVHGNGNVNITVLASDAASIVTTQQILTNPPGFDGMEGNRLYKVNGTYYILNDSGSGAVTWIWKSTSPFGTWTSKVLQLNAGGPLPIGGSMPNQGSLVQTSLGDWHFLSFTWAFPLGRIPVIAPISFNNSDGFPSISLVNNKWPLSYPNRLPTVPTPSWLGTDSFTSSKLSPRWEWNHNPDLTKVTIGGGAVTLQTVTVTDDLFLARNTLTHRLVGPQPVATIALDIADLADGDRAGLAAFKDTNSYIGVKRDGDVYSVVVRTNMTLSFTDWNTVSIGTDVASVVVPKGNGKIWFRGTADARPVGAKTVSFEYSRDGISFTSLGGAYKLDDGFQLFMGYRWGIFNHATKALGGSVKLEEFTQI